MTSTTRRSSVWLSAAALALACGGSTSPGDGGSDDGATDAPLAVDAVYGGPPFDAAADAAGDAPTDAPMDSLQGAYGGPPPDAGAD